jgi:hypothetical protein
MENQIKNKVMNIEKKALINYLNYEIEKTQIKLKECEERLHTNTTAINQSHLILQFRLEWLETQISSFQQFPIGFSGKIKF